MTSEEGLIHHSLELQKSKLSGDDKLEAIA